MPEAYTGEKKYTSGPKKAQKFLDDKCLSGIDVEDATKYVILGMRGLKMV